MKSAIAALASAVALTTPAFAQPPAPVKLEMAYAGVLNALHLPGEAKVLTMTVVERVGPTDFATGADIRTFGLLRALKHIDIRTDAAGAVEGGVPHPHAFEFTNTEPKRTKHVTITWTATDVLQTPPHKDGGHPPPTLAQKLGAADPVTVFSRAPYAVSGAALCQHNWRFFDGAQIYELQFQPGKAVLPTAAERALGLVAAEICPVRYAEIAGFTHRPGDHKEDWLSGDLIARFGKLGAGGPWIFVSLKADTFLGYAKIELTGAKAGPP
jgi:Protein of unknown function (DUF3108)